MNRFSVRTPIVEKIDGHFRETGQTSEFQRRDHTGIDDVIRKVQSLDVLLRKHGLNIGKNKSLEKMYAQARTFKAKLLSGEGGTRDEAVASAQLNYLIDPVLSAPSSLQSKYMLRRFIRGDLTPLHRAESVGKNAFWEFEVRSILSGGGVTCSFLEPDLVITATEPQVGIACKKIYSARNFEKTLSRAVDQIARSSLPGIVAINIDELQPENEIRSVLEIQKGMKRLIWRNTFFLSEYERILKRYLNSERIIAVLVSICGVVDAVHSEPRIHIARQSTLWNVPIAESVGQSQFRQILKCFNAEFA